MSSKLRGMVGSLKGKADSLVARMEGGFTQFRLVGHRVETDTEVKKRDPSKVEDKQHKEKPINDTPVIMPPNDQTNSVKKMEAEPTKEVK